jgi:DNA (cytosine-5)-methyltransferase 1
MGYHRAGFDVVGIDIKPQLNYPFEFIQQDVFETSYMWMKRFHIVHASPPCQGYSRAMRHLSHPEPQLIEATRDMLNVVGVRYVIENVPGAPLPTQADLFGRSGIVLCGSSFGLRIRRHRLFESNLPLDAPVCRHIAPAMNPHNHQGRERIYREMGNRDEPVERPWRREMGVEWMTRYEAREAIPPAYTEFVGQQLIEHLTLQRQD